MPPLSHEGCPPVWPDCPLDPEALACASDWEDSGDCDPDSQLGCEEDCEDCCPVPWDEELLDCEEEDEEGEDCDDELDDDVEVDVEGIEELDEDGEPDGEGVPDFDCCEVQAASARAAIARSREDVTEILWMWRMLFLTRCR